MVRSVTKKYQVWLAGYYDDFNAARAIPDDKNSPGTDRDHTNSHHGNPMNGEATLNPRYRWAEPDRDHTGGNEYAPDEQKLLKNDGIFEFISHDDTRQSNDEWEGRAQLQYPDGHVANRYKFGGSGSVGFHRFINGYDTLGSYLVPTGTNDATFGRATMQGYDAASYDTTDDAGVKDTSGNFVQRAHLAGVWMGEALKEDSSSNTPHTVFAEVTSPAKKPFLVVQSARYSKSNNPLVPVLVYDGPLNTRLDGDVFTTRMAVRGHKQVGDWTKIGLRFEIGFPQPTSDLTDTGFGLGTSNAAINQVIPLNYTTGGMNVTYDTTGQLYDSSGSEQSYTNDDAWIDIDFVMDYTNSQYDIYVNGTRIKQNASMVGSPTAANMYGYQISIVNGESGSTEGYVSYTMFDRVGLVRYLTDNLTGDVDDAPITKLSMNRGVNGISTCQVSVSDMPDLHSDNIRGSNPSNYEHNIKDLFVSNSALDWQLLVFGQDPPRIDRTIWRGIVDNFSIKQKHRDRILMFQANDALSIMDRTVPLWEVGQESLNDSEVETDYWLYEAQGFKNTMNLGSRELKLLEPDIGFDKDSSYLETSTQRTQLGSGHPIQMYNNENTLGPNNVEDFHEGLAILGFSEDTSGNTQIHLSRSDHGLSGTPTITITNSRNHNGTYTASSVSGNIITVAGGTLAVTGETAKIIYMGSAWGPFFDHNVYGNQNDIIWQSIEGANPDPSWLPDAADQPHELNIIFDADPGLNINDEFYVNSRTIGNTNYTGAIYKGRHRVKQIKTTRSYFNNTHDDFDILYWVKTYTIDDAVSDYGVFCQSSAANTDALKTGNDRVEFSKDTGTITTVTEFPERVLHARWMRDLPQSLWFQYHFGRIKFDPANNITQQGVYNGITYTPSSTSFRVPPGTYAGLPQHGIAEIYRNGNFLGKFIYQGKKDNGSSEYYLIGVKYMFDYVSASNTDKIKVRDIDNDYKHVWLLWSDMRNNGKANADGSERKQDFGLQYPISDNYEFELFYAEQRTADGNLDKFASLKNGDDISVWNIDSTADPITGGAFSKPADYANPVSATLGESSGKLTITISSSDMTNKFPSGVDFVHLTGSTAHDGIHTITGKTSTVLTTATTHTASTYQVLSSAVVYPTTGSDLDSSQYQDWEDKAGAFVVIDTSPFFNLNTHINNGRTGQVGGGRTNLGDYVATNEGFPMLIDNYWYEATPSYLTTDTRSLTHPNAKYLQGKVTLVTDIDEDDVLLESSYTGLPIDDPTIFDDEGYGRIRAIVNRENNDDGIQDYFFSYENKTDTQLPSSGVYTVSSSPSSGGAYGGIASTQVITVSGATFPADGVKEGMTLERTNAAGTETSRHNILNVGEVDESNTNTKLVVSGSSFAINDTFTIPPQLGKVFMTSLTDEEINLARASNEGFSEAIQEKYNALETSWSNFGLIGPSDAKTVEVHSSFGAVAMLRLLMHMDGFIKSRNSGTYFENDKIRTLWNAAITDSWLPPTRLTAIYDINNVPNTSIMTTYSDTTSNDSYGSILQTKGKTLASILNSMRQKSGFGDTNGLKTTFSYLVGRDGRIEFRPKFNSHLSFDRQNMNVANFRSQMTAQATHVRVYYNGGASFIDHPKPALTDTTRWRIIEMPNIRNSVEALQVAKQEFNKNQNTPMELTIEPILESSTNNKMIDNGRYGYICDPYLTLQSKLQTVTNANKFVTNWTRLGTGGVLFPGMVNALDGNLKTTTDIYARYGISKVDNSATTIAYNDNYTWYGSRSISYALQVVHVTENMPLTNSNGHSMRIWVDLKNQDGTSIDDAEFTITLADYEFSANTRTAGSISGSTFTAGNANGSTTINVKHSGFYEISVPSSYDSSAGGKIVVSFNAEYCRALLRHRCGNPSQTDHTASNYILDSSVDNGSGSVNVNSIFPLGKKAHDFQGGFADDRSIWYAPRVHICDDMKYHPASIVSVTDPGLGLNSATSMVVKEVNWSVSSGRTDKVTLKLERDESIRLGGLITQLYGSNNTGISNSSPPTYAGAPVEDGSATPPGGQATPPSNPPGSDFTPELVSGGTIDPDGNGYGQSEISINRQSSTSFGRSVIGRMDMNDLGNSRLSILGMRNEGTMMNAMRGIEGSDVSVIPTGGSAALTADGYVFGAKGLAGTADSTATSQRVSLQTQFTTPEDVINDDIIITAKVSCGKGNVKATAELEVTATVEDTGTSVTNTVKLSTNTQQQTIDLLPRTTLSGLKTPKNRISVTIVRKPGTGNDNANTSSVILHNLDVRMNRASIAGKSNATQFSTFS